MVHPDVGDAETADDGRPELAQGHRGSERAEVEGENCNKDGKDSI